ncbi:transcriptional regulator YhjC [Escherichia coli]|uniref:Transcriptional regulator YhjC n=1 Tax=Escherichia coli TaxID=562 RepID=A0A377JY65_ECOLX|nr:transcriptional regulator YhjC [Escherichia coli]
MLSNLSELDGLFQQDATSISGKLRIDIPSGIAKSLLLPRLSEFLYLHPGIELELSSHDRPVDILHDGFDCVIRTGALPEDGVIARFSRQTDHGQLCQSTLSDALWLSAKPR